MIEKSEMRYVSCPVCGRVLMKCQGMCNIEITCNKCGKEILVSVENEKVMVSERPQDNKAGQVSVSVKKTKQKSRLANIA